MIIKKGRKLLEYIWYLSLKLSLADNRLGVGLSSFVNNYAVGFLWGNQCFRVFDLHSKDDNGNISADGTPGLLKFESLLSLENYIGLVYYVNYSILFIFKSTSVQ